MVKCHTTLKFKASTIRLRTITTVVTSGSSCRIGEGKPRNAMGSVGLHQTSWLPWQYLLDFTQGMGLYQMVHNFKVEANKVGLNINARRTLLSNRKSTSFFTKRCREKRASSMWGAKLRKQKLRSAFYPKFKRTMYVFRPKPNCNCFAIKLSFLLMVRT